MSTRKTTLFYALLIAVSSLAVGMVIASRFDLTPASSAQTLAVPPMNSAPVTGPLDAQTFRNVAKAQQPMVVNIRTEIEGRRRRTCPTSSAAAAAARPTISSTASSAAGQPDDPDQAPAPAQGAAGQGGQGGSNRAPARADDASPPAPASSSARTACILTNNHVVEDATKIEVSLFGEDDDQTYQGQADRQRRADRQRADPADRKAESPAAGSQVRRLVADGRRRLGDGDRQPVQPGLTVTVGVISATQRAVPRPTAARTRCCRPTRRSTRATRAGRC